MIKKKALVMTAAAALAVQFSVVIAVPASPDPCDNMGNPLAICACRAGQAGEDVQSAGRSCVGAVPGSAPTYAPGCDQGGPSDRAICSDKKIAGVG
jgi:hypothetical protein